MQIPTLADIRAAHSRIKPYIHRTPVLSSRQINSIFGAEIFLKCENFQKVGAFKFRGATNAVLQIPKEAREKGVIFIRYDLEKLPEVHAGENGNLSLTVMDHVLGRPIRITVDLLVLASAILPNENKRLFELFKVPANSEGFLIEAHAKLRPVDFASEGLFMAGLAHYPKPIDETITQAKAAVARAMTILSKDRIYVGGVVASVDSD